MELYKQFEIFMQQSHIFFSAQAVFQAGATSQETYVPSLIVFSKIIKILTQKLSRKPPTTSCLVLAQREGSTRAVGFFGSSLHIVADKQELGAFRGEQLRRVYHPIQHDAICLNLPPCEFCAELISLKSNLVLWVPLFTLISIDN